MKSRGLHVLVVDDEQPARKKLHSFLKQEPGIDSIIEAKNGIEAAQLIREKGPDLVFLDIQMPGMNGFEVIEAVGVNNMPPVVFVTAYDQYAIDAFEVEAVDYLLKPYHQERFKKSFNRARQQIEAGNEHSAVIQRLLAEVHKGKKYLQRIMVKKGPRFFFVKTQNILYISAEEKYVKLHTAEGSHLIRETMGRMEERLDPSVFARIHRSTIVNLDFIAEIQPWSHGDSIVILKSGEKLTLSRRFRDRLLEKC